MPKKRKKKRKTARQKRLENLVSELELALDSDCWMVAIWSMNGAAVKLYRQTGGNEGFPVDDFPTALTLLESDLQKERERIESENAPAPLAGRAK